jgi:hypothetical protein
MVSVVSLCGAVLEKPSKKRTRCPRWKRRQEPEGDHLRRGPCISALLIARITREQIASCAEPRKLRTFSSLSLAKLPAVEPVEGDFGILADLDKVAVGITHVAAPFPPVIV